MRYEVYRDHNRQWRWRLRLPGGEVVAVSAEAYRRRIDAMARIDRVKASVDARVDVYDVRRGAA
ncbi:MAG: DUF1508 domain-containing protein [Gemmatimonadota bacterium]|nr:MAG: DUF1508 domain-containing protein [Gemmatimonadota bacterium]